MAKRYEQGVVLSVKVKRVVDGDTVHVVRRGFLRGLIGGDPIVVRLFAMDAPESEQKHGKQATRALKKMLKSSGLRLEVMDYDRYERLVGLLYRDRDGREKSYNLRMVQEGWAHAYTRYGGRDLGMAEAEKRARTEGRGLWAGRGSRERPEHWRRRHGDTKTAWGKVKFRMALVTVVLIFMLAAWWLWWRG